MIVSLQVGVFLGGAVPNASSAASAIPGLLIQSMNQADPNQSVAIGIIGNVRIQIQSSLGRVDFILSTLDRSPGPPMAFPLDLADPAVPNVIDAVGQFAASQSANRLALVMNAIEDVSDPAAAVALALSKLPKLVAPKGATEVEYRTNVPNQSACYPAIKFNRIHRWFTMGQTLIEFTPAGPRELPMTHHLSEVVDVNTTTETPISPQMAPQLYREMFGIAQDLYNRGIQAY